jgi:peptidoglycan/xylan/chitin deacetylase (PgdA/CDA1 family)
MRIKKAILVLLLSAVTACRAQAAAPSAPFEVVVLHDVVDTRSQLDPDSITTSDLVSLLEWLRAHRWTFISLDNVERASKGTAVLPQRAILLTIDDGYLSAYTRIFPLLLAYQAPAVIALEGSWMDGTASSGRQQITWEQAREMQASGLVEFASHTYDLHRSEIGNPQGNVLPAAAYHKYDPGRGYEGDSAYRERIAADLKRSIEQMAKELGRAPRALAWPYGRYTAEGEEVAHQVGFTFSFTLEPEPAFPDRPIGMGRHYLSTDVLLESQKLLFREPLPAVQRLVHVNPADILGANAGQTDERLGKAIERLRELGATAIVIDAVEEDSQGKVAAAWFPNSHFPVRADLFLRIAWQMHTRAGVAIYASMPVKKTLDTLGGNDREVIDLFHELGVYEGVDGMFFANTPGLAAIATEPGDSSGATWEVRRRRDAVDSTQLTPLDSLTLRCFHAVEAERPALKLAVANRLTDASRGPSAIADVTLVITSGEPKQAARLQKDMHALGWFQPIFARRFGLWIDGPAPPAPGNLALISRKFQKEGGAIIGWRTDDAIGDKPPAAKVSSAVSSATFPVRF